MKLVRFSIDKNILPTASDRDQGVRWGVIQGSRYLQITGDPLGQHILTDRAFEPAEVRLLPPCTPSASPLLAPVRRRTAIGCCCAAPPPGLEATALVGVLLAVHVQDAGQAIGRQAVQPGLWLAAVATALAIVLSLGRMRGTPRRLTPSGETV